MREIRPSGSGEGAVLSRPYLIRSRNANERTPPLNRAVNARRDALGSGTLGRPPGSCRAKTEWRRWRETDQRESANTEWRR